MGMRTSVAPAETVSLMVLPVLACPVRRGRLVDDDAGLILLAFDVAVDLDDEVGIVLLRIFSA